MQFNKRLLDALSKSFISSGKTLAVAESVTSGTLQAAISQAKDASKFFQGGITVYNLGQKYKHLNVEPIHAMSCDCVSEKVATEMSRNVCELFGSNIGIGITGFATKVPEEGVNELYAFLSISENNDELGSWKVSAEEMESDQVQKFYVDTIIEKLAQLKLNNMNKEIKKSDEEKIREEKKEANKQEPVHKGYNEKTQVNPEGSFKPDSKPKK